jgi:hypothetical protein
VQAPHSAMPQPYFVPVSLSSSRMTHNSGVLGSALTETGLPFKLNATISLAPFVGVGAELEMLCSFGAGFNWH